jgi:hypothetical protein
MEEARDFMMTWLVKSFAFAWILLAGVTVRAAPLTYYFHGAVTSAHLKPYGLTIPAGGAVTGQFSYDPASLATRILTNGLAYEQQIVDGFKATIGGVAFDASAYEIQILNNVPLQGSSQINDEFIISFSSAVNPPLQPDLIVNGTDRSSGLFSIAFAGNSSLFSDASLPPTFNYKAFPPGVGIISDQPTGVIDAFIVTPEPSTSLLFILGLASLGVRLLRQRRQTQGR